MTAPAREPSPDQAGSAEPVPGRAARRPAPVRWIGPAIAETTPVTGPASFPAGPLRLVRTSPAGGRKGQPELPPARQWLDQLLVVMLECLEGWRPLVQLRAHASPLVIGGLAARRRTAPHRPNAAPRVRSLHVTEPCPGVVEACAVVNRAGRVQGLAIRLEVVAHRWRCTAFGLLE